MRPMLQESPYLTGRRLQHSRLNEDIGKALDAHHELIRSLSERLTTPRGQHRYAVYEAAIIGLCCYTARRLRGYSAVL